MIVLIIKNKGFLNELYNMDIWGNYINIFWKLINKKSKC